MGNIDDEKKEKEKIGENSGPLMLLQLNAYTDCNADACSKSDCQPAWQMEHYL